MAHWNEEPPLGEKGIDRIMAGQNHKSGEETTKNLTTKNSKNAKTRSKKKGLGKD